MKTYLAAILVAAGALGMARQMGRHQTQMADATTETYEHLATAIIEIRATEDGLVKSILIHHLAEARHRLDAAREAAGSDRGRGLEQAAREITAIAHEGDKAVQAIRQRLLQAGHHHHTDSATSEDYIFIDSAEKRALLALAAKISRLGGNASETAIREAEKELGTLFDRVIAPE